MCLGRPVWRAMLSLVHPGLPADVADDSVMHNWPSFSTTLENCILHHDIRPALGALDGVPVYLIHGTKDATAPIANVRSLAEHFSNLQLVVLHEGDHDMFLSHTAWCLDLIADHTMGWTQA